MERAVAAGEGADDVRRVSGHAPLQRRTSARSINDARWDGEPPAKGYLYLDALYIEEVQAHWPDAAKAAGKWHLIRGRAERITDDLASVGAGLVRLGGGRRLHRYPPRGSMSRTETLPGLRCRYRRTPSPGVRHRTLSALRLAGTRVPALRPRRCATAGVERQVAGRGRLPTLGLLRQR